MSAVCCTPKWCRCSASGHRPSKATSVAPPKARCTATALKWITTSHQTSPGRTRLLVQAQVPEREPFSDPAMFTGTPEWHRRPPAIALPANLRNPEHWFMVAGIMKTIMLCLGQFPWVFHARGIWVAPWPWTYLPVMAGGAALAYIAGVLSSKKMYERRGGTLLILVGSLLLMWLSHLFFTSNLLARPQQMMPQTVSQTASLRRSVKKRSADPRLAADSPGNVTRPTDDAG